MRRLLVPAPAVALAAILLSPGSSLRVEVDGRWQEWWRADAAPTHWTEGLPQVRSAVRWRDVAPGVQQGELRLAGSGEAWRTRAILVAIEPSHVRAGLVRAPGGRSGWRIADAPPHAIVALNAGQFEGTRPWGWLLMRGRERQPPGRGPLALGLAFDEDGAPHWIPDAAVDDAAAAGGFREAFQSFPLLLTDDGRVPWPLQQHGRGIDLVHRDARLGICALRDGRMLIALTRFDGLGGALGALPLGLTTQEMAALMGALDCGTAMLLDGGISAQLMVRDTAGTTFTWPGMRRVPLGLVFIPRS